MCTIETWVLKLTELSFLIFYIESTWQDQIRVENFTYALYIYIYDFKMWINSKFLYYFSRHRKSNRGLIKCDNEVTIFSKSERDCYYQSISNEYTERKYFGLFNFVKSLSCT